MASSSYASAYRRPSFSEDDGLASIAEFSGAGSHLYPFVSRIASLSSSPRSGPGRAFNTRLHEATPPHFLDSCSLCKKPLGCNRDIFMYRGDMPFCSEECREEQMEMDDAMEKSRSRKAAMRTHQQQQQDSSSRAKSQKYPLPPGIAAA